MSAATPDGQERSDQTRSGDGGVGRSAPPPERLATIGAAVVCLLAALYLAINHHEAALLKQANLEGLARRFPQTLATARQIHNPPADGRALAIQAYALAAMGRPAAADAAFARAVRRDPNNWVLHQDWAVLLARRGNRREAGRQMRIAVGLNPRLSLPPGFVLKQPQRSARRSRAGRSAP